MESIGIIAAMQEELDEILNIVELIEQKNIYEITFYIGEIKSKKIVLVKSGVGKVNAARVTQILIDKFNVNYVINVGSAGQ